MFSSLSSPSDSDLSDYEEELDSLRARLNIRYQRIEDTPDSSEIMNDIPPFDSTHIKLRYQGKNHEVLRELLEKPNLFEVLNKEAFESLSEGEKRKLLKLLPEGDKKALLEKLWSSESNYFRSLHPIKHFKNLLHNNYFTDLEEKVRNIESKIYKLGLKSRFEELKKHANKWHEFAKKVKEEGTPLDEDHYEEVNSIWKKQVLSDPESVRDFNSNIFCKENSSSEDDEYVPELSESIDEAKVAVSTKKEKRETKLREPGELDELLSGSRFQDMKCYKNQITIEPRSKEWIEYYRKQEVARYGNPTRPWLYYNENSSTSIVGPVAKKQVGSNSKPREHQCLVKERPACITILCLTRDAASRLPDGIGTRADICELITDSQYLVPNTAGDNISNIVSGALDRLHYESDPCVKYDTERKIWIYLHKKRTLDHSQWASSNNIEPNSLEICSLKKEDAAKNGESIVVIKLDEMKPGKRDNSESEQISSEGRASESSYVFKRHRR